MFVTARMLGAELGLDPRTILRHAAKLEEQGIAVKARIGKPVMINRSIFMMAVFPGWKEEENGLETE